jgi:riboflavin kinase / FMN adenylyltransferase
MQRIHSIDDAALHGAYLAVGSFDGLHRGHRYLLEKIAQAAREDGAPSAVLTFFPHPRAVLGSAPFRYLSTLEERLALLEQIPLDAVILQTFDRAFSAIPAETFLQSLKSHLGLHSLWCGPGFSIGYRREGNVEYLTNHSIEWGYALYVVPPLADAHGPISSSRIRDSLAEGDAVKAAALLGRRYTLSGKVVHGAERGRKMSVPTANLDIWPEMVVPAHGVYATWAVREGKRYRCATSVGVRPTFSDGRTPALTVEAHLLDFDGDLYDATLKVEFVRRLREERRFPDSDSLSRQMTEDIKQARRILQEEP